MVFAPFAFFESLARSPENAVALSPTAGYA